LNYVNFSRLPVTARQLPHVAIFVIIVMPTEPPGPSGAYWNNFDDSVVLFLLTENASPVQQELVCPMFWTVPTTETRHSPSRGLKGWFTMYFI
jgi:hypothetical protein